MVLLPPRTRQSGKQNHLFQRKLQPDRKSTRLNSSHANISYAVFCLKKKKVLLHRVWLQISNTNDLLLIQILQMYIDTEFVPLSCLVSVVESGTSAPVDDLRRRAPQP